MTNILALVLVLLYLISLAAALPEGSIPTGVLDEISTIPEAPQVAIQLSRPKGPSDPLCVITTASCRPYDAAAEAAAAAADAAAREADLAGGKGFLQTKTDVKQGPEDDLAVLTHDTNYAEIENVRDDPNGGKIADLINPANIEFALPQSHFFSCLDPRAEYAVLGTPGGDIAEFINALAALEKLSKSELSLEHLNRLFQDYLRMMTDRGKHYFYMHTDADTLEALKSSTGAADPIHPSNPEERNTLLHAVIRPEHIGCRHLKAIVENGVDAGVRTKLATDVIKVFFNVLYDMANPLRMHLLYIVNDGELTPTTVSRVRAPNDCNGAAPLLVPNLGEGSTQSAIYHDKHVNFFRQDLARFASFQDSAISAVDIYNQILEIAKLQEPLISAYSSGSEFEISFDAGLDLPEYASPFTVG